MDVNEKEAVLSLVPYFSKDRVVFDVGSNKGEWADILVHDCEMHLFEPNIKLLHYTEIKYAHLDNVKYHHKIVSDNYGVEVLRRFENEYNGLSSVYDNPKWNHLKSTKIQVASTIIGDFKRSIDLLKIDVEGAEWDVIQGAEQLLIDRKIRFIQIEYSEHYKVPGYKFQTIIDFVKPFGYQLYDYDGHWFKAKFKENYQHKNYYFMLEGFTEDWNLEFRKNTAGMKFDFVLEIGCFEGLTTCHICDFMLNEGGRIICIDPLEDEYIPEDTEEAKAINKDLSGFKGQYDRFIRNTAGKPVELIRKPSRDVLKKRLFRYYKFDFIYIDGDHRENQVYLDGKQAWEVLQLGAKMLFDDYTWSEGTKKGIDKFLKEFEGQYQLLVKDTQVMIQKNNTV